MRHKHEILYVIAGIGETAEVQYLLNLHPNALFPNLIQKQIWNPILQSEK